MGQASTSASLPWVGETSMASLPSLNLEDDGLESDGGAAAELLPPNLAGVFRQSYPQAVSTMPALPELNAMTDDVEEDVAWKVSSLPDLPEYSSDEEGNSLRQCVGKYTHAFETENYSSFDGASSSTHDNWLNDPMLAEREGVRFQERRPPIRYARNLRAGVHHATLRPIRRFRMHQPGDP
mmetsp:Transcript_72396/g.136747  ORF Transcript_72396/g.136747 Transcript_72396/m.136747 type:complete len:181 (+) Transcript_72396:3-545(+)